MKYSEETKSLLEKIKIYQPLRPSEMVSMLGVSTKTVYKHLGRLLDNGEIIKTGESPLVYYSENKNKVKATQISNYDEILIESNYIYISPSGEVIRGIGGFQIWCEKNKFDFKKEKKNFVAKLKNINKIKSGGFISGKNIILNGKKEVFLDDILYSDFYTIDYFGKTKLGQLVFLGKTSQSKALIREIAQLIQPSIETLIEKFNIKYSCFIPPTIDRKVQFLDTLKDSLNLKLIEIKVQKVPGSKVPQKSLRKLEDRIENAQKTIAVNPVQNIDGNVLIIDDATGSGATLNETARKIRNITNKKVKIIGYSVVGSSKGFDVISEV